MLTVHHRRKFIVRNDGNRFRLTLIRQVSVRPLQQFGVGDLRHGRRREQNHREKQAEQFFNGIKHGSIHPFDALIHRDSIHPNVIKIKSKFAISTKK